MTDIHTSEIDTYPEPEHGPEGMGIVIALAAVIMFVSFALGLAAGWLM
jgi:hypothetical protein